jgi:hypothetical protein
LLVAGEGSQAQVVDHQHPLASFVLAQLANVAYRAHFDTRGMDSAQVFASSYGGAAIAVELPMPAGRLIFVPALKALPTGDARYVMSESLQSGIRRAVGVMATGREPAWIVEHELPGLDERAKSLDAARDAAGGAERELQEAEAAHAELAHYRRLLWQEGALGLEDVVAAALRLIGFEVYSNNPNSLELRSGGVSVMFEVEGSERPVDLAPHYRLRQRIERAIERRGEAPRGVVFVNGERLRPPRERTHVTDALRTAAETMRYCVAPTAGLYDAVVAQLRGEGEAVAGYRARLLATDGILR